ncbi:hypothetical protein N0V83_009042 [Neocucurbitaria cava]|uniref:Ankyrin repeat protein n=1 Tax=Neocucurbitaria cava TaxID=798079 RepID=A0A9W8Y2M8_9PLEO|nr:hypothetical protein N0V83_009042 [Neocucurbitaria cava]
MTSNIDSFLKTREIFLEAAADLLKRPEIGAPQIVTESQMFLPCRFARFPAVVSQITKQGKPDCLGRSVAHIIYDAGEWPPTHVDSCDILGRTVLYLACLNRDFKGVKRLLKADAELIKTRLAQVLPLRPQIFSKLEVKAANGLRPLDVAVIAGDTTICKEICDMAAMNATNIQVSADIQRQMMLDQAHTDKQVQDQAGVHCDETCTQTFRRQSEVIDRTHEILKLARNLANKVSMNAHYDPNSGSSSRSPLMWAAFLGHGALVQYLRTTPTSIGALTDRFGYSAIGLAAMQGHLKVIKYLVDQGCQHDSPDVHGRSPFWYAARNSHYNVLIFLHGVGVYLDRKDNDGFTPLAVAARDGHADVVAFLLDDTRQRSHPHLDRWSKQPRDDFLSGTNSQQTPLFLAASGGHAKCVNLLLQLGSEALGDFNIQQAYAVAQGNSFQETCKVFESSRFPAALLHGHFSHYGNEFGYGMSQ